MRQRNRRLRASQYSLNTSLNLKVKPVNDEPEEATVPSGIDRFYNRFGGQEGWQKYKARLGLMTKI